MEQRRWPKNAEAARTDTLDASRETTHLLARARQEIKRNPLLAEMMIADAITQQERIQRLMVEAKVGRDE